MRSTKVMLSVLVTFMLTYMFIAFIGYALGDLSYKECLSHGGTMMFSLVFGWIPSAIVGRDVYELLNK